MSYARLSKRPLLFRSFTGLEISEFDAIYVDRIKVQRIQKKASFQTQETKKYWCCWQTLQAENQRKILLDASGLLFRLYITFTLS